MSVAISVLLPTYNCADILRPTLESVRWADEILVVDSFSKDGTLDLCREYGARIIQHEYINSAKQKNWAAPQCRNEWVLQIDSDEVLEEGAREEIQQTLAAISPDVQALRMPRKNDVLGRWMQYGGIYPDYQIRLFRRSRCQWREREVHAHLQVEGEIGTLQHHIVHAGMPNLSKQLANLNRYTRYEADELRKDGRRFRWHDLLIRPWKVFFYRFLWLQGFRDGWRGLILSSYYAMYDFIAKAKLWELEELSLDQSPR